MKIIPSKTPGNSCKYRLINLTVAEITAKLGFEPNCKDDPFKVKHSWSFRVKGSPCGIWDYKGSEEHGRFSADAPLEVLIELFGQDHIKN